MTVAMTVFDSEGELVVCGVRMSSGLFGGLGAVSASVVHVGWAGMSAGGCAREVYTRTYVGISRLETRTEVLSNLRWAGRTSIHVEPW